MQVFRPTETMNGAGCGIHIDVEVVGDTSELIDLELITDECAQILDPESEGIYVEKGRRLVKTISAIACQLSCDRCAVFTPADYSVEVDRKIVEVEQLPDLATRYAKTVIDISHARASASLCARKNWTIL
jgi:hypothetical protein